MNIIKKLFRHIIFKICPEISILNKEIDWNYLGNNNTNNHIGKKTKLFPPFHIVDSKINDYTYVSFNANISLTTIGKYCSIGPNLVCGWGIHPTNGISTSPSFYSTKAPNGITFSTNNKIEERKPIKIGNDVFIGANVTILDGVTIGDGAVIGAGAVVSKDIPPYAIAIGCPIQITEYRFSEKQIEQLLQIEWWNFDNEKLQDIERYFFDIDSFIAKHLS